MAINEHGIVSASKFELLAIWLFDDDLFRLIPFGEWFMRCIGQGVKVNG